MIMKYVRRLDVYLSPVLYTLLPLTGEAGLNKTSYEVTVTKTIIVQLHRLIKCC